MSEQKRILVVAHRTAATPVLLGEIRRRAEEGFAFDLLVPDVTDPADAKATLKLAVPVLQEASGKPVEGLTAGPEPFKAIQDTLAARSYDEVIISTLPRSVSRWLDRNLPRRVLELGLPVTVVTAAGPDAEATHGPAAGEGWLPGVPGLSR